VGLIGEKVRQFMAQGHQAVARRVEHNFPLIMVGFCQEKGGAVPIFSRIGQVFRVAPEVNRLLAEGPAEPLAPGLQVLEGTPSQQPVIVAMATITPDLPVANQVAMLIRVQGFTAFGAVHQSVVLNS